VILGPDVDPDDDSTDTKHEELVSVAGWAAHLDPTNYQQQALPDGQIGVQYQPPAELMAVLAPTAAALARGNQAYRLSNTYAHAENRRVVPATLLEDLALARDLATDPPEHGPMYPEDTPAAVAAAAVLAHAHNEVDLPEEALRWASGFLLDRAERPRHDSFSYEQSTFLPGADRSAAAAIPALFLPAVRRALPDLTSATLASALTACTTSLFNEVRRITAEALAPLWDLPCVADDGGTCVHEHAFAAVAAGVLDCPLGPVGGNGERTSDPLTAPLPQALSVVPTESLMITRLVAPIMAAADAAASNCCVVVDAQLLLDGLLMAHRRGAILWADKGYYGNARDHHYYPARVLFRAAARGDLDPLLGHLHAFAGHAAALSQLLRDLAELATYDPDLRAALPAVWPAVLRTILDDIDQGADPRGDRYHSEDALAHMLPHPQLAVADTNPDATLTAADADWIDPALLADLIGRWLPLARGEHRCVDAVVRLARTATPTWQATVGLVWVSALIGDGFDRVAGRCWFLPDWLEQLRASGQLHAAAAKEVQRIIDGLAVHGDSRAVALQRADE
jgi:hypothetical protein